MNRSVAGIYKKDNKFLMGKRKPGGSIGGKWEFPGGKVKANETLEESLKREFLEELESDIIVKDFITQKSFNSHDHNFDLYAYYIELVSDKISLNEHTELSWFTIEEIKEMINYVAESDRLLIDSI